ncbi:MAG TPA: hypothetical protein VF914_07545 [Chloroflexia bacterium]
MSEQKNKEVVNEAQETRPVERETWEPMKLEYVGNVGEVLQGGRGKLSLRGGDPGEPRKQKGGHD